MHLSDTLRVPLDQFSRPADNLGARAPRKGQFALLVPGALIGVSLWVAQPSLGGSVGPLLTATSIMTGFTFAMANTFWTKSIEARRDPRWAVDGRALDIIDRARTHMIWTVGVGVVAVGALVIYTLFSTTVVTGPLAGLSQTLTRLGVSVIGGLIVYVATLVGQALWVFNHAIVILKS